MIDTGTDGLGKFAVVERCGYGIKLVDNIRMTGSVEFGRGDAGPYLGRDHIQNLTG